MATHTTLSSSPAFATPLHPIPPTRAAPPLPPPFPHPAFPPAPNITSSILPIRLPPPTLRPLAFRTFTKKYSLTLTASALQALATFIGRHCGVGWREQGTGEKVLDHVARFWKAEGGAAIVEDGEKLQAILNTLQASSTGGSAGGSGGAGRVGGAAKPGVGLSRESSFAFGNDSAVDLSGNEVIRPRLNGRDSSFGLSALQVHEQEQQDEPETATTDVRAWLKVLSAHEQPRLSYDMDKKHFVPLTNKPTLFPPPSAKTALVRERYNTIHQRLLRNEAFQTPSFTLHASSTTPGFSANHIPQFYKVTPIANLLGRGGSSHLLLGQLIIAPTGTLALDDPSGSIALDLAHAQPLQGPNSAYFCPGMIVLVDGVYEEDWAGAGASGLGGTGGVGGTVGGRFLGFSVGGPPVERRNLSLGIDLGGVGEVGAGFGWTDFTGLGSERAVGARMRRLEKRLLLNQLSLPHTASEAKPSSSISSNRSKMIIMSEVTLDQPSTLAALRSVLQHYDPTTSNAAVSLTQSEADVAAPPLAFLLLGNFSSRAALAGAGTGSIEYKELFNNLAAVLSDFPALLRQSTWIFVPGDNDAWEAAFGAGASSLWPKEAVPEVFTSRVRRAFAAAKAERAVGASNGESGGGGVTGQGGEPIWTSNPARVTLFGPQHEVLVCRDDVSGRLRRQAIRVGQAVVEKTEIRQRHGIADDDNTRLLRSGVSGDEEGDVLMSGALPASSDALTQVAEGQEREASQEQDREGQQDSPDPAAILHAKKLILTLLPQSTLSPFPLSTRPVHWSLGPSALSLYPLPHTLVLADAEAEPFALTFEGCHVLNPGRLVRGRAGGRRRREKVGWVEYDFASRRGEVKEGWVG